VERTFTEVNEGFCEITGYSAAELLGQSARMLYASDAEFDRVGREKYGQIAAHGAGVIETRFRRKDGGMIDVLVSSAAVDPTNPALGTVSTILDITRHKATEAALHRERLLLAHAARVARIGGWEWDLTTNEFIVSREWQDIHGCPQAVLPLEALRALAHPDDLVRIQVALERLARGEPYDIEHRIIRGTDGAQRIINVHAEAVRDEHGRPVRAYGAVEDITARREAEEAVRRLNAELEDRVNARTAALARANAELEAFNYSVSHDLRGPLRHIEGFAEILSAEHGSELSPDARRCIERIGAATLHMGQLIDALLLLSRLGRTALRRERIDLGPTVREAFRELTEAHEPGRVVDLILTDLPPVVADSTLLRQLFDNLLANAVKFTRHSHPSRIRVGSTGPPDRPVFYVRDNGVGFDPARADRLFDPFRRLHASRDFEGTGIGLSIVKRIVLMHGGWVWAESHPGEGATFYFTFGPAHPDDSARA